MELYKHQEDLVKKNPRKHLLAWETGTGKTAAALALARHNDVDALIIVPKALRENWQRSIQEFNPNHMIVTKEEFRKYNITLPKFNAIIIDEFHYFGNEKSLLSKALKKYTRTFQPKFIWGLTATPYCSSAMNIYSLANHLGTNFNYWSFVTKYFNQVRMGTRMVPIQKADIEDDLAQIVKNIGSTMKLEDCADIPEQTFETVYLTLTAEQKKSIKAIDDSAAITRWTRQHTIENGVRIGDEYNSDEIYANEKEEYILNLAEQNPKMAVICRYNLQIYALKDGLEAQGHKVFVINGAVSDRDEVIQEVEKTEKCIVLIQAATAVGFEIPSVPIMVFASLSFSHTDHVQALGRILRINKLKKNVYIYLVIKDGIDEDVYKSIMNKMSFDIAIYSKERYNN